MELVDINDLNSFLQNIESPIQKRNTYPLRTEYDKFINVSKKNYCKYINIYTKDEHSIFEIPLLYNSKNDDKIKHIYKICVVLDTLEDLDKIRFAFGYIQDICVNSLIVKNILHNEIYTKNNKYYVPISYYLCDTKTPIPLFLTHYYKDLLIKIQYEKNIKSNKIDLYIKYKKDTYLKDYYKQLLHKLYINIIKNEQYYEHKLNNYDMTINFYAKSFYYCSYIIFYYEDFKDHLIDFKLQLTLDIQYTDTKPIITLNLPKSELLTKKTSNIKHKKIIDEMFPKGICDIIKSYMYFDEANKNKIIYTIKFTQDNVYSLINKSTTINQHNAQITFKIKSDIDNIILKTVFITVSSVLSLEGQHAFNS